MQSLSIEIFRPESVSEDDFSGTIQDYLRHVYMLQEEGIKATRRSLRQYLRLSAGSVSRSVLRLTREGLVVLDGAGALRLTPFGRIVAESVTRRHRLAERMLSDVLGVPLGSLYVLADGLEHTISQGMERQLQLILGNPTHCPHGNPIAPHAAVARTGQTLSLADPGSMTIQRLPGCLAANHEAAAWLQRAGVLPGRDFAILRQVSWSTWLRDCEGRELEVPRHVASLVRIQPRPR